MRNEKKYMLLYTIRWTDSWTFWSLQGGKYYSIKDAQTEEVIVPFGSGSIVSCDTTGNYFNLWLNGLQPERIYNVQFKATVSQSTSDEQDVISLQDHTFKVSR